MRESLSPPPTPFASPGPNPVPRSLPTFERDWGGGKAPKPPSPGCKEASGFKRRGGIRGCSWARGEGKAGESMGGQGWVGNPAGDGGAGMEDAREGWSGGPGGDTAGGGLPPGTGGGKEGDQGRCLHPGMGVAGG